MKKTGFTLAEVLITFGIIGIVAAITLPGLNNNVSKSKIGPALAKAVNTLEAANKVALLEYEVSGLDEIDTSKNYLENISTQLSGHTVVDSNKKVIGFQLKDGVLIELYDKSGTNAIKPRIMNKKSDGATDEPMSADDRYNYEHYVIIVDVNASKIPNKPGTDQFMLYVDTAGTVIPAGGIQAERYFKPTKNYQEKAHKARDCKKRGVAINEYCAGTIMEDGWQVKW